MEPHGTDKAYRGLCEVYERWLERHGLDEFEGDALELMAALYNDPGLYSATPEEAKELEAWLALFVAAWEALDDLASASRDLKD